MIRIIEILLKQDFRYNYFKFNSVLISFLSVFLSLGIYWYTSQAIGTDLLDQEGWNGMSYFDYVVFGEVILLFPIFCVDWLTRATKISISEGLFDYALTTPLGPYKIIRDIFCSGIWRQILNISLTLFFATVFFSFPIEQVNWGAVLILEISFLPTFLGLGIISSAIVIQFGKGQGVISKLLTLLTVGAGLYFPVTTFPEWLQSSLSHISPVSILLTTSRDFFFNTSQNYTWVSIIPLAWSMSVFSIAIIASSLSIRRLQRGHGTYLVRH